MLPGQTRGMPRQEPANQWELEREQRTQLLPPRVSLTGSRRHRRRRFPLQRARTDAETWAGQDGHAQLNEGFWLSQWLSSLKGGGCSWFPPSEYNARGTHCRSSVYDRLAGLYHP